MKPQPLDHTIFFLHWKCSIKTILLAHITSCCLLPMPIPCHPPILRGPDKPFYIVQAADSPQFHSGGKRRVSSPAHCSSTSPWSHSWGSTGLRVGTEGMIRAPPPPQTHRAWTEAHRMGKGSHFTGGMVRLGHPVSTLDLIVECRIHHHARVGCATWEAKKKTSRVDKYVVHCWSTWGDTAPLENVWGSPLWSIGSPLWSMGSFKEIKCYHLLDFTALPKS